MSVGVATDQKQTNISLCFKKKSIWSLLMTATVI